MNITLDWWLAPSLITAIAIYWAYDHEPSTGDWSNLDFEPVIRGGLALCVSLSSWLVYLLAT